MSGKEIKKKKHLFGLRIRVPPVPPNAAVKLEKEESTSHEFKIKGRKSSKLHPITKQVAAKALSIHQCFLVIQTDILSQFSK